MSITTAAIGNTVSNVYVSGGNTAITWLAINNSTANTVTANVYAVPAGSAANTQNLILTNIKTDETGNYQLRASNECGAVSSNTSVLTVVSKPKYSIITPSSDLAICSATYQTKTISVNIFAINGATPSIVWSTSDGSITGYNTVGNTANVTVASVGKDATYNAELSNSCGTTVLTLFSMFVKYSAMKFKF